VDHLARENARIACCALSKSLSIYPAVAADAAKLRLRPQTRTMGFSAGARPYFDQTRRRKSVGLEGKSCAATVWGRGFGSIAFSLRPLGNAVDTK
jgi:hypothetical protein